MAKAGRGAGENGVQQRVFEVLASQLAESIGDPGLAGITFASSMLVDCPQQAARRTKRPKGSAPEESGRNA